KSKEGQQHRLDIGKLIDQLEVRSRSNNGAYSSLTYDVYQQDSRIVIKAGDSNQNAAKPSTNKSQARPKEEPKPAFTCPHCKRGNHPEEECWIKHPEKRPSPEELAARREARMARPSTTSGSANSVLS